MQSRVICHDGTCFQCTGEGTVITIKANSLPVSLCLKCLAFILSDATGIRSAIVKGLASVRAIRPVSCPMGNVDTEIRGHAGSCSVFTAEVERLLDVVF